MKSFIFPADLTVGIGLTNSAPETIAAVAVTPDKARQSQTLIQTNENENRSTMRRRWNNILSPGYTNMSEYLNATQLAERLQVTPATIHAWHRRGWIPCLRAGRRPVLFDLTDVLNALRQRGAVPVETRSGTNQ